MEADQMEADRKKVPGTCRGESPVRRSVGREYTIPVLAVSGLLLVGTMLGLAAMNRAGDTTRSDSTRSSGSFAVGIANVSGRSYTLAPNILLPPIYT